MSHADLRKRIEEYGQRTGQPQFIGFIQELLDYLETLETKVESLSANTPRIEKVVSPLAKKAT